MRIHVTLVTTVAIACLVFGALPRQMAIASGVHALLDKSGSGQWTSPVFDPTSDWQISYSYNCANTGSSGNFIVDVYGPGNSPTADGANELKRSGRGTTYVHDVTGSGTYIQVTSECNWHVTASGPGKAPTFASTHPRKVLLRHGGSGQWTSPTFWPRTDWEIAYSYNCASQGGAGNFIVDVYGPGNAPSPDGVNELKTKGGGTTFVHDVKGKGSYIQVDSECSWEVTLAQ